MKKELFLMGVITSLSLTGCAGGKASLKNPEEKTSYAIGYTIGKDIKNQKMEIKYSSLFSRGIQDALEGKEGLKQEEIQQLVTQYQNEQRKKQEEEQKTLAEKNLKTQQSFLEENKKKEGVTVLSSGLQYRVIKKGNGKKSPSLNDRVIVHYRGRLIDGTEFDSSYNRNQPTEFPVNGVIRGWTEALQQMVIGDQWELIIPSELAYGERSAGNIIGPNSALVFEIELLEIKSQKKG